MAIPSRLLLKRLTQEHVQDAYNVLLKTMFETDPVTKVLGASFSEMSRRGHTVERARECVDSGLSTVALDTQKNNKVVGALFVNDKPFVDLYSSLSPKVFEPFAALRKELLDSVQAKAGWILTSDTVATAYGMAVEREYQGIALGHGLLDLANQFCVDKGFKYHAGYIISKRLIDTFYAKYDHQSVALIKYEEFEYKGYKPFQAMAKNHEYFTYSYIELK